MLRANQKDYGMSLYIVKAVFVTLKPCLFHHPAVTSAQCGGGCYSEKLQPSQGPRGSRPALGYDE